MPKFVPQSSIVVFRPKGFPDVEAGTKEQANYTVPLGQPFDFTDEEVRQIKKMVPEALSEMAEVNVRKAAEAADGDDASKKVIDNTVGTSKTPVAAKTTVSKSTEQL